MGIVSSRTKMDRHMPFLTAHRRRYVSSSRATISTVNIIDHLQFSEAHVTDLERIRDIIHDLSVAYGSKASSVENYDQMSLEQFAISKGASERTVDMIRVWARVMVGIEASVMSAQFFIEYTGKGGGLKQLRSDQKHGGQYLRFRKGTLSNLTT